MHFKNIRLLELPGLRVVVNRRRWFALAFCVATVAVHAAPPNIVVILADDLGYGDVSAYRPGADIRTPHLDQLAAEGMRFTGMRSNCTVCSPSRAALMSGRFPDRVGVPGLIRESPANSWGYFDPKVKTLGNELQALGYHTAAMGKWNLGLTSPCLPNERGFDLFQGFLEDMMDSYTTHLRHGTNFMRRNTETVSPQGHATDIFTDWACAYLRERSKTPQPFFLYLAYNAPHFPIEPPADWLARVEQRQPGIDHQRALNVALVEHLDDGIGRVLAALRESKLERNTLVFVSSDNGGLLSVAANNGPWRGGKTDHYDGGLRVPFIARWPEKITAGSQSDYAGLLFDVFATSVEVAGGKPDADLDAVSLVPLFSGRAIPAAKPRELYFVRRDGGPFAGKSYEALIRGDWKLLQNDPFRPFELYNLREDPGEQHNLITQRAAIANELKAALRAHIQRGGIVPWEPPGFGR